jgi:hypothetical protein
MRRRRSATNTEINTVIVDMMIANAVIKFGQAKATRMTTEATLPAATISSAVAARAVTANQTLVKRFIESSTEQVSLLHILRSFV